MSAVAKAVYHMYVGLRGCAEVDGGFFTLSLRRMISASVDTPSRYSQSIQPVDLHLSKGSFIVFMKLF